MDVPVMELLVMLPLIALAIWLVYSGVNAVRETWSELRQSRRRHRDAIARWKEARDAVAR